MPQIYVTYPNTQRTNMQITNRINGLSVREAMIRPLILLFSCLFPCCGYCQTGGATADALAKAGFENVSWKEDGEGRIYVIQNSAYRLEGMGIGVAVDIIQRMGLPYGKPRLHE